MRDKTEFDLISAIADRAIRMQREFSYPKSEKIHLVMDIDAAHKACPMKLSELLGYPDSDFAHDVFGIVRHLDRETKQITDCFIPRCSV